MKYIDFETSQKYHINFDANRLEPSLWQNKTIEMRFLFVKFTSSVNQNRNCRLQQIDGFVVSNIVMNNDFYKPKTFTNFWS